MNIDLNIKNIHGEPKSMDLFQFFDDGIRKRLPKNLAEDFRKTIVENIDNNVYGFELSQRWIDYKLKIGADTRPFIMFGYYKNGISVVTENGHLSVGFKKSAMHPRAKISLGKLAIALEYGDAARGIPARPLWRNSTEDFFAKRDKVGKIIKDSLDKKKSVAETPEPTQMIDDGKES